MKAIHKKLSGLTLFSIAMGFMEAAVVVYLRKIYYPSGFRFPLIPISQDIALVEFLREAATIIMLLVIGFMAGKTTSQKFAFFIYCFAIWDLSYYLFLKLLLHWPESFFTWDILFLIPVPWVGPVLAPCLVSLTMIVLTLYIIKFSEKGISTRLRLNEWGILITGCLIVIASFMSDYLRYIRLGYSAKHIWALSSEEPLFSEIANYIPADFNWWLFAIGEIMILLGIMLFVKRIKNG